MLLSYSTYAIANGYDKEVEEKTTKATHANETKWNINSEKTKLPKVSGSVTVELVIEESGNIVSARALCGHPVLQTLAVKAALQSKFERQPATIRGNIVYNFVP